MAWKMVLTYLHFRILEISHWSYAIPIYPQPSQKSPRRDHDHDMGMGCTIHVSQTWNTYLNTCNKTIDYDYTSTHKKNTWNIITDYAILYIYTNEKPITESNSIMPPHDDCLALPSVKPLVHWCASALPFQHGEHCRTPWFVIWAYSHHVRHPALGGTSDIRDKSWYILTFGDWKTMLLRITPTAPSSSWPICPTKRFWRWGSNPDD